jgi:hypothetical protein
LRTIPAILAAAFLGLSGNSSAAPPVEAEVSVPFVGCLSDGQLGPQAAPAAPKTAPSARPSVAARLAYYSASDGDETFGALAPRGWHCFGLYGSNGTTLIVTPEPHSATDLLQPNAPGLTGPAVQLSVSEGGTSGRFEVAAIAARVFPAQAAYVRQVARDQIAVDKTFDPAREFPKGPYRADRIVRLSPLLIEFETPAHKEGLGTHSRLLQSGEPINGFAEMDDVGDHDLVILTVRLPPESRDLTPAILKAAERQEGQRRRE